MSEPRKKQTARKSTNSSVPYYKLAEPEYHEERHREDGLGQEDDDASMESDSERLQTLRLQLDHSRSKLSAELQKGTARDQELRRSLERCVKDLGMEVHSLLQAQTGQKLAQAITQQGQEIAQVIEQQGENLSAAINESLVDAIQELGNELAENLPTAM